MSTAETKSAAATKEVKEITFSEAFATFLNNDSFHDLTLVCNDGVGIGANSFALSARNEVFQKMLMGSFLEANEEEVKIDYDGTTVAAIVEYIHTNKARILTKSYEDLNTKDVQYLVSTHGACDFFELPAFAQKIEKYLRKAALNKQELAFAVYDGCVGSLGKIALTNIKKMPCSMINAQTVAMLKPKRLEELLKNQNHGVEEERLFFILHQWAQVDGEEQSELLNEECRKTLACDLAKNIHLERIDPEVLLTLVAPSDLVEPKQLLEAQNKQLLVAKQHGVVFKRMRYSLPVWKKSLTPESNIFRSSTNEIDILDARMTSGTFKWTLEVVKLSKNISTQLGVTIQLPNFTPLERLVNVELIGRPECCGYTNDGLIAADYCEEKASDIPTFGKGSKVTFTLKLPSADCDSNGTLSVSVDGGGTFVLYEGLVHPLKLFQGSAYMPAVSHRTPGHVRLLSFEQIES